MLALSFLKTKMAIRNNFHQGQHPSTKGTNELKLAPIKPKSTAFTYSLPTVINKPLMIDALETVQINWPEGLKLKCLDVKEFQANKFGKVRARIYLDDATIAKLDELYDQVYSRLPSWFLETEPVTVKAAYYLNHIDVGVRKKGGELEKIMHYINTPVNAESYLYTVDEHNASLKTLAPTSVDTDCQIWLSKREGGFAMGFYFLLNKFNYEQ